MESLSAVTVTFPSILHSILPYRVARQANLIFDALLSTILCCIGRFLSSLRTQFPTSATHLSGKTAIVTGANSGIGYQIALDLARLGARVVLACRSTPKGEHARQSIIDQLSDGRAGSRTEVRELDTSKLGSVSDFARIWKEQAPADQKIDVLVHNAGIASVPEGAKNDFSQDGFELIYATNVLGSYLLTYSLEHALSSDARCIFTSSPGQYATSTAAVKSEVETGLHASQDTASRGQTSANGVSRYAMSKSMQCAMAKMLQSRWDAAAVNDSTADTKRRVAHSFSPGFTTTPIFGKMGVQTLKNEPLFAMMQALTVFATDVREGAATGSWLAFSNDQEVIGPSKGGRFWERCVPRMSTADLMSEELLRKLWKRWQVDAGIEWN